MTSPFVNPKRELRRGCVSDGTTTSQRSHFTSDAIDAASTMLAVQPKSNVRSTLGTADQDPAHRRPLLEATPIGALALPLPMHSTSGAWKEYI
jgi:hypothetical protein